MGVVYLARHRQLGRDTALKVMIGGRRRRQDQLRFDREARLAASLSSPHSVMIYDYGRSEDGESYCVMEFLRGLTLQEVVQRSGPQPVGRVLFILSQVCEALSEAHDLNLLHRDIKPQNIMLSLDQSVGDWAVLFDYGLAKPLEPAVDVYQTSEAHWSGTPMYMAPERFRQPDSMDRRSDIYSIGCVAYYLLSGHPPFVEQEAESLFALILSQQPTSLEQLLDEPLPQQVSELVMSCMAKSPDDRFATVADLSVAINNIRGQHPWTLEEARSWWDRYGRPGSP
jgi:serine/threonine protein kinase